MHLSNFLVVSVKGEEYMRISPNINEIINNTQALRIINGLCHVPRRNCREISAKLTIDHSALPKQKQKRTTVIKQK